MRRKGLERMETHTITTAPQISHREGEGWQRFQADRELVGGGTEAFRNPALDLRPCS